MILFLVENLYMEEYLRSLPKAELHIHIEGSYEAEHILINSKKNNIDIPYKSVQEINKAKEFQNLQSFLDLYYAACSSLIRENDFYNLMWE